MTDKPYNNIIIPQYDYISNKTNKWTNIRKQNNINEISIILYSFYLNKLLILLGKESNNGYPNKTDTNLISNFRGRIINDESIPQAAGRILFEKTMNMIIEPFDFEKMIIDNKVKYIIEQNKIIFLYQINYHKYQNVPEYYGKIFKYLTLCTTSNSMNNWVIESCPLGFLDKSDLYWTNINDIKNNSTNYKKKFLRELYESIDDITNSDITNSDITNIVENKEISKPFWFSV